MADVTRSGSIKKGKKQQKALGTPEERLKDPSRPMTFVYSTYINYAEVAAILLGKLDSWLANAPDASFQYFASGTLDPEVFAKDLELLFDSGEVHELMSNEIGQGIMLGLFLSRAQYEEAEALEDGEEG